MKHEEFVEKIRHFKPGDGIRIVLKGDRGNYQIKRKFKKVDDRNFVHLDDGSTISYKTIVTLYPGDQT